MTSIIKRKQFLLAVILFLFLWAALMSWLVLSARSISESKSVVSESLSVVLDGLCVDRPSWFVPVDSRVVALDVQGLINLSLNERVYVYNCFLDTRSGVVWC